MKYTTLTIGLILFGFISCLTQSQKGASTGSTSYSYDVDSDGDGFSDGFEWDLGSNPYDSSDTPDDGSGETDLADDTTSELVDDDWWSDVTNYDDSPDLPNLNGNDGGENILGMMGQGVSAFLALYGLSQSIDLCVTPSDAKEGVEDTVQTDLLAGVTAIDGGVFTGTGTINFEPENRFTRVGANGAANSGWYYASGNRLMLVVDPFQDCVEVYKMSANNSCICTYNGETQNNTNIAGTPGRASSITISGNETKSGLLAAATYVRNLSECKEPGEGTCVDPDSF